MLFKIAELKNLLLSLHKQKIKNINIQSSHLRLNVSTTIQKSQRVNVQNNNSHEVQSSTVKEKEKTGNTGNQNKKKGQEQNLFFTIVSPMIGTFYRSPGPNEATFIKINDYVKANQTVCIIEAMKLMNEIESEVNGQIMEILVEDGDIVDCGQALMRVKEK